MVDEIDLFDSSKLDTLYAADQQLQVPSPGRESQPDWFLLFALFGINLIRKFDSPSVIIHPGRKEK